MQFWHPLRAGSVPSERRLRLALAQDTRAHHGGANQLFGLVGEMHLICQSTQRTDGLGTALTGASTLQKPPRSWSVAGPSLEQSLRKPAVRPGTHPSLCPAPRRSFLGMILGVHLPALFMNIEICIASAAHRSGCLVSCYKTIRTHSCAPGTQALCCWLNLRIHH